MGVSTASTTHKNKMDMDQKMRIAGEAAREIDDSASSSPYIWPYNVTSEESYEPYLKGKKVTYPPTKAEGNMPLPSFSPIPPLVLELSEFRENNSTETFGIIALAMLKFSISRSKPHQLITVYADPTLNLGRGGYGQVSINHVLNSQGENIYDRNDQIETTYLFTKIFDWIGGEDIGNPSQSARSVSLISGVNKADVVEVQGTLRLFLPINPRLVTLTKADVGKARKDILPDSKVTLEKGAGIDVCFKPALILSTS